MRTGIEGVGLGLRMEIADALLGSEEGLVDFVEIHPENYVRRGGPYARLLERARRRFPIVTHGLAMSFGSVEPFDPAYLADLDAFLREVGTPFHSDHACFGSLGGHFAHDLLPVPFDRESRDTVVARVREAEAALSVPVAVENVSYYVPQGTDPLDEARFLVDVLERTSAGLLLDVNNVVVNARNHGFDPARWLDLVPAERVFQIHVAGHFVRSDGLRIDTHGEAIPDEVYEALAYVLRRIGPRPILLERDQGFPSFDALADELRQLRRLHDEATRVAA